MSRDDCDVSIVISTRNRSRSLCRTISSVVTQDAPGIAFEVIVVDNNSTDDTPAVIRRFLGPGSNVRSVFEGRTGVSNGRNAGIAIARAPIVAFTDDDVAVSRDWVRMIKRTLDERPDVGYIGGKILGKWEQAPPRWLDRRHWSPLALIDYGDRPFEIDATYPLCMLTANMAVRREVFDRIGLFSPEFRRCQDHELQMRYWRAGGRALYVPDLVVVTEVPAERLTKRYHRAWHRSHGEFSALMRLSESIGADASLLPVPQDGRRLLFGSPGYLYRELFAETMAWLESLGRMHGSEAFAHGNRLRYLLAYLHKRREVTGMRRPRRAGPASTDMRRRRLWLVHALIAILVGGHLWDIALDREHWPFSQYPMFSDVDESTTHRTLRLFGVSGGAEFPLLRFDYLEPLDQCRVSSALIQMSRRPAAREDLRTALDNIWTRYEARRDAGRHAGPPLAGIRLYALEWKLDSRARNADQPDVRELLMEFRPSRQMAYTGERGR